MTYCSKCQEFVHPRSYTWEEGGRKAVKLTCPDCLTGLMIDEWDNWIGTAAKGVPDWGNPEGSFE